MDRTSTRNNFLDILLDPMAVTILVSIALHAIMGAYLLPFFTQAQREGKKAEPGTVKVVELTPSELQRIPQAPTPVFTPSPSAPQTLPSVSQPITPTAPSQPQISTTIPASPIRTPVKQPPAKQVIAKPPKGTKSQQAKPQSQPAAPNFNPNISFNPSPKPSEPSPKQGNTGKPSSPPDTQPTPVPTKPPTKTPNTPNAQSTPGTDSDGDEQTSPSTPIKTGQQPPATPQPSSSPNPSSGGTQPSPSSGSGDGNGSGFYGKYTQAASDRLQKYIKDNPGLKTYPPQTISQPYPQGAVCSKVKQPPFIVLMVAFGKVPDNQDHNVLGDSTAPSIDKPYVAGDRDTPENRKLGELAANTALFEANKADQNRPKADQDKPVLYQYRVQFDPATCKN